MGYSPSSAQFSPRKQANGLLGLGFVSAGLLLPNAMATKKLCPVLWQQLLLKIKCTKAQQATAPKPLLLGSHATHILKLLCMTVGADLKNLQQDCKDVALQLRVPKRKRKYDDGELQGAACKRSFDTRNSPLLCGRAYRRSG